jgi:hypothetical protein
MFVLSSEITVGKFRFKGVNEVKITKSIHELADIASIKIPASTVLKQDGIRQTESRQTAKQFSVGDKVTILLGYDGNLKEEFIGFVKRVNFTSPAEIECEGFSWLLRNKRNIKKTWKTTTLKEVLQEVISGTVIKLHPQIPQMPLKNLVIDNASGTQVIEYLIKLLNGALTACFYGDVLYVGLTYMDVAKTTVKYRLGWNTINAEELKFHNAEDIEINIQIQFGKDAGVPKIIEAGAKGGIVRKQKIESVTDEKHLKEIAEAKLKQESFDGYEGTIKTFLVPFVQHGYRGELTDSRYPERAGNYFIVGVVTTYGQSGGKRDVEIGIRLS